LHLEEAGLPVLEEQRQVLSLRHAPVPLEGDDGGALLVPDLLVLHEVPHLGEGDPLHLQCSSGRPYAWRSSAIGCAGFFPRTASICSADIVQSVANVSGCVPSISPTTFRACWRLSA